MKSKRFLLIFLVSVVLASIGVLTKSNNVSAVSWEKTYRAVVTQPKTVYYYSYYEKQNWKLNKTNPRTLQAGQMIHVTRMRRVGTRVTGTGMAYHNNADKLTMWLTPSFSTSWYDVYQKHMYLDAGLFTGSSHRIGKTYHFTWKQYCKLVRMGLWTTDINNKSAWARLRNYAKSVQ